MSMPEADKTFRDSGDLRRVIEGALKKAMGTGDVRFRDRPGVELLGTIAHALVNISDDIFVIRERLNEGVKIQEGT